MLPKSSRSLEVLGLMLVRLMVFLVFLFVSLFWSFSGTLDYWSMVLLALR